MYTVLLAGGQHAFRTVLAEVLRTAGYVALEGGTAEEALRVARRHSGPIHLLVTEAVVNTANGEALAARIREQRPDLRVLVPARWPDVAEEPLEAVGGALEQDGEEGTYARKEDSRAGAEGGPRRQGADHASRRVRARGD